MSKHTNVIAKYYGSAKTLKMGDNTITTPPNLSSGTVDEQMAQTFFTKFDSSVKRGEDCQNSEIRKLVLSGKLKANQGESFKDYDPVALNKVYTNQSYPFDVWDCTRTCQHTCYQFDACKKQHMPLLFMTLIVWGIGMKKMKEQKHQI